MEKPAAVEHPVHELIRRRWSPRAFARRRVEADDLRSVLEVARWAPSCFNDQPWFYLLATQDQEGDFAQLLDCLVEKNQRWAKAAPVLMISVARQVFAHNGKPHPTWQHDVGLASATLTFEALSRGLFVHQMAGIDREKIKQVYNIPAQHEPVAGLAVGYPGNPDDLPEEFRDKEKEPRTRKGLREFVFSKMWGQTAELLQKVATD